MIALIGLGEMGRPVAERLIAAGNPLTVHPRKPDQVQWARERGAVIAGSLNEAIRDAEFIILCLFSDEQVREVVDDRFLAAMQPGATIILHTTGRPDTAIAIGHRAAILDAPFSGTARDIAAGAITLLVGGADAVLARCRAILCAYANPILHVGPLGSGQRVKLVNNLLFAAHIRLALDADRLLGGNLEPLLECSGSSRAIELMSPIGAETFAENARRFIRKDVAVCLDVAAGAGIDTGILGRVASRDY